jgi:hypothetical protein
MHTRMHATSAFGKLLYIAARSGSHLMHSHNQLPTSLLVLCSVCVLARRDLEVRSSYSDGNESKLCVLSYPSPSLASST